jgi:hypothetical protein
MRKVSEKFEEEGQNQLLTGARHGILKVLTSTLLDNDKPVWLEQHSLRNLEKRAGRVLFKFNLPVP